MRNYRREKTRNRNKKGLKIKKTLRKTAEKKVLSRSRSVAGIPQVQQRTDNLTKLRIAGGIFTLGLFLMMFPLIYNWKTKATLAVDADAKPTHVSEATYINKATSPLVNEPIKADSRLLVPPENVHPILRILIPGRNIDLPIAEAKVINGYWEVSETSASHGNGSAYPGENGNIVIFAHARTGMFLPLRDINADELIYILGYDRWYRYRVVKTKLVDPKEVEVVAPTEKETLTLFTCSGFLDSKRLIVTAIPFAP